MGMGTGLGLSMNVAKSLLVIGFLLILARQVLEQSPGACVIGEVKCSEDLFAGITAAGGGAVMSAVGHSILKERMVHEGALF